jgi:hypothetical protein
MDIIEDDVRVSRENFDAGNTTLNFTALNFSFV